MILPIYETNAGNKYKEGSISNGDIRLKIESTMPEECKAYRDKLISLGYELISENELPSSLTYGGAKNLAYKLRGEDSLIHIFYNAPAHTVNITAHGREDAFPSSDLGAKVAPFYCQLPVVGLCHVARLRDGRFIIIDSGDRVENNEEIITSFLFKHSKGDPTVALWLFTHPDCDHILAAEDIIRHFSDKIRIEAFAYQFPDFDKIDISTPLPNVKKNIQSLEDAIATFYPNTPVYTLHTGDKFDFPGATLTAIFTLDNIYPLPITNCNDVSAAFRLEFESGRVVMILGDCTEKLSAAIEELYGANLKADILQVAHHGLIGGNTRLYERIDPDVCLWTTTRERFSGNLTREKYHWCLGEGGCEYNAYLRDESIKKREHYTMDEEYLIYV